MITPSEQTELSNRVKEYKRESDQAVRRTMLGGSNASTIAGVNPFSNKVLLWEEKTGVTVPDDISSIEKIRWGVLLEDTIAREYALRTGKKVRNVNRTLYHPDYKFIGGHIDRKIENEEAGLEVKAVGLRQSSYWTGEIPKYYEMQVLHYLAITGYEYFDVAALIGGQELRIFTITREGNEQRIDKLVEDEVKFWNEYVLKKQPPPPESTDETALLYKTDLVNKIAYLNSSDHYLINEYHENIKFIKEKEKRNDAIKTVFQNSMKDAQILEDSNGEKVATWKTQTRSSLDQKQMKISAPDICAKYTKEQTIRRFSVIDNNSKKESNERS